MNVDPTLHDIDIYQQILQVNVTGTDSEAEAAKIARSVASSSLVKAWWLN